MNRKLFVIAAVLALVAAACGGGSDTTEETSAPTVATTSEVTITQASTTSQQTTTSQAEEEEEGELDRTLTAVTASITVDGDPSDWVDIEGLPFTMEPIAGEEAPPIDGTVKVAYDDTNVYVLFTVDDDYNWSADDPHLSGSAAVMWAVEPGAGEHMGTDAEDGEGPSLGMVDIWHWELECPAGTPSGGINAVAGSGNDPQCNLDDEWATDPETREDDEGANAENSILGVFTHSAMTEDADGTWYFEFSRPLQTGDPQDAQFAPGGTALLALAYWDPDVAPDGWEGDEHVQTSNQGWITVEFK